MGGICVSYLLFNHVTRLRNSIDKNSVQDLKHLLAKRPHYSRIEIDHDGNTPLFYSILAGKDQLVKFLLEFGVSPNESHTKKTYLTPLFAACSLKTHLNDSMDVLTSQDLTSNDHTSVRKIVSLLIAHGADVNKVIKIDETWFTPLSFAIKYQNIGAIDALLLNHTKLDINYQEPNNYKTALHEACQLGNVFVLVKLLDRGANPYLRSKDGNTPIHMIASNPKDDITCLLAILRHTKYLINLNSKNSSGQTPLMLAAMRNKKNTLKYLLDNNASLNTYDSNGKTALYYARQSSCLNLLDSFSRMKRLQVKHKKSDLMSSKLSLNLPESQLEEIDLKLKYKSAHSLDNNGQKNGLYVVYDTHNSSLSDNDDTE